jgi:hypothetical protein
MGEPFFEVERRAIRRFQLEREDFATGERIDTQNAQVFTRRVGKRHYTFHDRGGGLDPGKRSYRGQNAIVEIAPDFQVRPARREFCSRLKACDGPTIGDLDGQENRDAQRDS